MSRRTLDRIGAAAGILNVVVAFAGFCALLLPWMSPKYPRTR
jgi:hypothetical protein